MKALLNSLTRNEKLWLLLILCMAAFLRFYHYAAFSYSNDELSAINRLQFNTFGELVQKGFYVDGHPGGVQVFLWYWVKLFGNTELSLRFPFVIFGILSVFMVFLVARRLFGTSAGLFSAATLTFLQFPLLYSQIARPYGAGMLFCLLLVYFWIQLFFDENRQLNTKKPGIKILVGFALSAALCMYTHYFSFLFALIVGISGFFVARKNNIIPYLISALIAVVLFIPHIPITLNHLTYKGVGLWLGIPGKWWIFEHLFYIFDQSVVLLVLLFCITLFLLFTSQAQKTLTRFRVLLLTWFLLPILIGYVYSVQVNPVLQHSVLIFSFPCAVMLIFSYAGNSLTTSKQILLGILLFVGILNTTVIDNYYKKQHFGEFRNIAALTVHWQNQFGRLNMTEVINVNAPFYIQYYLKRMGAETNFDLYSVNNKDDLETLGKLSSKSQTPYFLYALTKPTAPEGEDIIRSFYPNIIEYRDYSSLSSIALYSRTTGKSFEAAHGLSIIYTLQPSAIGKESMKSAAGSVPGIYSLDSTAEYSPGCEILFDKRLRGETAVVQAECDILSNKAESGAILVISIETPEGKSLVWKGAETRFIEIPGKWSHVNNTLTIGEKIPEGAKLKVYIWNKDKKYITYKNLVCKLLKKVKVETSRDE